MITLNELRRRVDAALQADPRFSEKAADGIGRRYYAEDVELSTKDNTWNVIINDCKEQSLLKLPFTVAEDDTITLAPGAPTKTEMTYVDAHSRVRHSVLVPIELLTTGDEMPKAFPLLRFGLNKSITGRDEFVDEHSGPLAVALQKDLGIDLPLDFHHGTTLPSTGQPMPIAAHFSIEDRGQQGIWATVKNWTKAGIQAIKEHGYKYLSAEVLSRKDTGKVVGILSAALTHTPDFVNATTIFATHSSVTDKAREIAARHLAAEQHNQSATADEPTEDAMPQWLLELLGLKKDATEDQVKAAAHSRLEPKEKIVEKIPAAIVTALGLKEGATETEIAGTIHSLKGSADSATQLSKRVEQLEARGTETESEKLITAAHEAGKLTEAMLEWARGEVKAGHHEQLKGFLEKAPVIVPLGQRKSLSAQEHAAQGRGTDAVLHDSQRAINKQLGITDEDWKKQNGGK